MVQASLVSCVAPASRRRGSIETGPGPKPGSRSMRSVGRSPGPLRRVDSSDKPVAVFGVGQLVFDRKFLHGLADDAQAGGRLPAGSAFDRARVKRNSSPSDSSTSNTSPGSAHAPSIVGTFTFAAWADSALAATGGATSRTASHILVSSSSVPSSESFASRALSTASGSRSRNPTSSEEIFDPVLGQEVGADETAILRSRCRPLA